LKTSKSLGGKNTDSETSSLSFLHPLGTSRGASEEKLSVMCNHKKVAVLRKSRKNDAKFGKQFWTCADPEPCDFLVWEDELDRQALAKHQETEENGKDSEKRNDGQSGTERIKFEDPKKRKKSEDKAKSEDSSGKRAKTS